MKIDPRLFVIVAAVTLFSSPALAEPLESTPIDTSITVHQGPHTDRNAKGPLSWKSKFFKTGKDATIKATSGLSRKFARFLGKRRWQRNAIGALVKQDNEGLNHNAAGALVEKQNLGSKLSTAGAPQPPPRTTPVTQRNPDTLVKGDHAVRTAALKIVVANGLSLSGGAYNRPGFGTAATGGPAQINRGVLSGSMFHPRHP